LVKDGGKREDVIGKFTAEACMGISGKKKKGGGTKPKNKQGGLLKN